MTTMKMKVLAASVAAALLSGCGGGDGADNPQSANPGQQPSGGKGNETVTPPSVDESSTPGEEPGTPGGGTEAPNRQVLKIGILPDTQGGGENVSIHPMEAVL